MNSLEHRLDGEVEQHQPARDDERRREKKIAICGVRRLIRLSAKLTMIA